MTTHEPVRSRDRRSVPATVATVAVVAAVLLAIAAPAVGAGDEEGQSAEPLPGDDHAHELLSRARAATALPHSGRVTVVSFTDGGPRVAELAVTVADDEVVLRSPARVIVPAIGAAESLADAERGQRVPTAPLGLDVDAILAGWQVGVRPTVVLETGPATPVELVREGGSAIRETLYVDEATGIPVRRETRDEDGEVLRVVAYTSLDDAAVATGPREPGGTSHHLDGADVVHGVRAAGEQGFAVPPALGAGFELVAAHTEGDTAVARYTDGLSVLSVYQQHGELDADTLDGAAVAHVAGRDVWTWPGREPVRYVWSGDGRTWTAVSDAPAPVIEDALADLPGDLVGHDAAHRLRRGLDRVWDFVTAPLR